MSTPTPRKALIFDADDTLWENNALFEKVVEDYLDWLAHPTLDRTEIRRIFADIEKANVAAHGYGSRVFLRNLHDCFAQLNRRPASESEAAQLIALAADVIEHRIELMPAVTDVLSTLGARYDIYLLTKGEADEQRRKIEASGLARYFISTHIVSEKTDETYRWMIAEHRLNPATTWMIGNSPRSDINPARRAGLNAVFIPSRTTWVLEREEIDLTDSKVLRLDSLSELINHF